MIRTEMKREGERTNMKLDETLSQRGGILHLHPKMLSHRVNMSTITVRERKRCKKLTAMCAGLRYMKTNSGRHKVMEEWNDCDTV